MSERKHDYVPSNPAQFNAFMLNLLAYVSNKPGEWTNIPQVRLAELNAAYETFAAAFQAALGPHTPAQNPHLYSWSFAKQNS